MYFHTDDDLTIAKLAEATTRASANGQRFRISVEGGVLKYKVGEGMWSPPIHSTPDPYRDEVQPVGVCLNHRNAHRQQPSCDQYRKVAFV